MSNFYSLRISNLRPWLALTRVFERQRVLRAVTHPQHDDSLAVDNENDAVRWLPAKSEEHLANAGDAN